MKKKMTITIKIKERRRRRGQILVGGREQTKNLVFVLFKKSVLDLL